MCFKKSLVYLPTKNHLMGFVEATWGVVKDGWDFVLRAGQLVRQQDVFAYRGEQGYKVQLTRVLRKI